MGLSLGSSGALSELLVCADLIQREYQVFRSVSPNADFDIVAFKDNQLIKIEVRTTRMLQSGINFPIKESDIGKFDLLALVLRDKNNEIVYFSHDEAVDQYKLRKKINYNKRSIGIVY